MESLAQFFISKTEDAMDLPLPARQTPHSAGLDLHAKINVTIDMGARVLVPTGIKIALPFGYEAQIRGRSGLALKHGVTLANGVGTIDADYRGEIHALLTNHGQAPFVINQGDRIAQMVIAKVAMVDFVEVETLEDTSRGTKGFGSTGV